MEVRLLDVGVVMDRLNAGDFEAVFRLGPTNPGSLRKYLGSKNPLGYENPEVVRLTDQAVATADDDELDRIYRALTEILRADLPVTCLVPQAFTTFAHRRVGGPSTSFLAVPDRYLEHLSLATER